MTLKTKEARTHLLAKGFREEKGGDHCYLHFYYEGKKTIAYTKYSHGALNDDVNASLVNLMKRQLGLGTSAQARKLIDCTMDEVSYIKELQSTGKLPASAAKEPVSTSKDGRSQKKK